MTRTEMRSCAHFRRIASHRIASHRVAPASDSAQPRIAEASRASVTSRQFTALHALREIASRPFAPCSRAPKPRLSAVAVA